MTEAIHAGLAAGRWRELSLIEQLGNLGSEVGRMARWQGRNEERFLSAYTRALELFDLTIRDERWRGRLKELTRARTVLHDACQGGIEHGSTLEGLEAYFMKFAVAARLKRAGARASMSSP